MPAASPAGVAIRFPVRQSGVYRRDQTVGFSVGTKNFSMAESCTDSVTYADSDRNTVPPASANRRSAAEGPAT